MVLGNERENVMVMYAWETVVVKLNRERTVMGKGGNGSQRLSVNGQLVESGIR